MHVCRREITLMSFEFVWPLRKHDFAYNLVTCRCTILDKVVFYESLNQAIKHSPGITCFGKIARDRGRVIAQTKRSADFRAAQT